MRVRKQLKKKGEKMISVSDILNKRERMVKRKKEEEVK